MTDLRWDDLKVLLALYRAGSLKRAAETLGVNISTVSRRLTAVETLLDTHLFDRTSEGTRPTAAIEQLVPFAERMEHAAHEFARGLSEFELAPEGVVRLTAPPGVVEPFLAPALIDLTCAYPRLRIQIVSSIGYADLTRAEADLALRLVRPTTGDLVTTRLGRHAYSIIAAPTHAASLGRLSRPDDTRWMTWGEELAHLPDARWIEQHVTRERVVLETNSMGAQLAAVRSGLGVMLAPVPYAGLPGLTAVDCAPALRRSLAELPEGAMWLVGHRALRDVPRISAVWTWICRRFGSGG